MTASEVIAAIAELDDAGVSAVLTAIASRLAQPRPPVEPLPRDNRAGDETLTLHEAAAVLRRSTKWLYRHRATLPFVRKLGPRSYVVSRQKMENWLAKRPS
jgi:predicted DNA-binding transcriptional regulator AlpA